MPAVVSSVFSDRIEDGTPIFQLINGRGIRVRIDRKLVKKTRQEFGKVCGVSAFSELIALEGDRDQGQAL